MHQPAPPASADQEAERVRLPARAAQEQAIFTLDPQGQVSSWNPAAERLTGYRADEIIGKHFSVFYTAEDVVAARPQRSLEEAIKTGSYAGEGRRVRRDRSQFWAQVLITPLLGPDGTLRGFAKVSRDITEEKRGEDLFHALLEAAPDAMVIVNESGVITLVNAQTERLFGYDRGELIGQPVEVLIPEDLRAGHVGHRTKFAQEPRTRAMGENLQLTARRRDGTEFSAEISLSPIPTERGLLVASSIRDVTARRRMEKLSTFGQLAASIGHELRNPLGVIDSSLFILRKNMGSAEIANKHFDRIGSQLKLANEIVTKLLDMIRDRPPVRGRVTISDLVASAAASLEWPPGVTLVESGLEGLPPVIGDQAQLRQVLVNLLENAIHASSPKGEVRVIGSVEGPNVLLAIEDTGPGVDAAVLHHLFEPLVTTKAKGIGLGLALVRRILENHGGSIAYQPGKNGGARFSARLVALSGS